MNSFISKILILHIYDLDFQRTLCIKINSWSTLQRVFLNCNQSINQKIFKADVFICSSVKQVDIQRVDV